MKTIIYLIIIALMVDVTKLDDTFKETNDILTARILSEVWSSQFDEKLTTDRDFYCRKDQIISLPTMYKRSYFNYTHSTLLKAQIIELPYEGEQLALLVVLPTDKEGITQLQGKLKNPKTLEHALENMNEKEVDLYLPKFKIETETNLKDVLNKMGVKSLFTLDAELTKLIKNTSVYVSGAFQRAVIELNERGAEANAANVINIGTSGNMSKRTVFRADHPFVFFIRRNNVIFVSGVYRP